MPQADLASIVAKASFLWECLDTKPRIIAGNTLNEAEIHRRLQHWCDVVAQGNWQTLNKRLQWEDVDLDTVRPYVGTGTLIPHQPLPEWAETLRHIMQMAARFPAATDMSLPTDTANPMPFEDLLLPVISVARQQLLSRLGASQLTADDLPCAVLTAAAYRSLERGLLQRLALLCAQTFDSEFAQVRPFGHNVLNLLGVDIESTQSKTAYNTFIRQLLQDGLGRFFQHYPVLGRLVATVANFWVEATAEFIQRLAQDSADIQRVFVAAATIPSMTKSQRGGGVPPELLGKVSDLTPSLSDPHNQGRTVMLLTFECGLQLVYKPKDLGLEAAFNQFLDWCNRHSLRLDFKVMQVLNRDGYGWVEYVEQQPCADAAAAERFYERAGMLLCVLYALRATDCHYENLIASGEHLVLIDMETLLHHEANVIENSPAFQQLETRAGQQFWNSVLRTGLLPRWDFNANKQVAYDISGLGSIDPQQVPHKVRCWRAINTDNMHLRYETVELPVEKNVPFLGDIALSPNDYQSHIVGGFEHMYRFLMVQKAMLLSSASPLAALQHQHVRFVFRATRIYDTILHKALGPDSLQHGVDYSIELDRLSRAFLVAQDKPPAWPILQAELRALERLDIPCFTASAASDVLRLQGLQDLPQCFKQPSYQQVLSQVEALDESDLTQQMAIIRGSFHARVARTSVKDSAPWEVRSLPLLTPEELLAEAQEVATELEAKAIQDPDGSVNWIGLGYVSEAERFQLQVLGDDLYDGCCGIALFFAALYQVSGALRYRDLALQALQPLRQRIQHFDSESQQRFARLTGIGGGSGVGSMIYGLAKVSQCLTDHSLLPDAQRLAGWITPELIAADTQLDVINGAAGAILGLLSLYAITGEASVLEQAIACGQHVVAHRVSYEGAPKAWATLKERPLTGFSHGAAGIAYALLRLYAASQDQEYADAAREGIAYERQVFSATHANWPDFRGPGQNGPPGFVVQWCHGAPGIGLGRLGSIGLVDDPELEREIAVALQTTRNVGFTPADHLCCGNLGLAEVLWVGTQRLSRPDWQFVAQQQVTNTVARARQTGGYRLFSNLPNAVFNPGFFQGVAGIGYELLRLAGNNLPSVLLWE
jgi:type 2 lantibiotic biosynthesis protein LanM